MASLIPQLPSHTLTHTDFLNFQKQPIWLQEMKKRYLLTTSQPKLYINQDDKESWQYFDIKLLNNLTLPSASNLKTTDQSIDISNDLLSILSNYSLQNYEASITFIFIEDFFCQVIDHENLLSENKLMYSLLNNSQQKEYNIIKHFLQNTPFQSFFSNLSILFLKNTLHLNIPENQEIEHPIHLLFYNDTTLSQTQKRYSQSSLISPSISIHLKQNSHASLIEHYVSSQNIPEIQPQTTTYSEQISPLYYNSSIYIEQSSNSSLSHYKFQEDHVQNIHTSHQYSTHYRDSQYTHHNYTLDSQVVKNHIIANVYQGANCNLYGISALLNNQYADNHTIIKHIEGNNTSKQTYLHLLKDNSTAVFQGNIHIDPKSQNVQSNQYNHTLLLSDKSNIYTKPQLDIFANQVKCAHGATVGQLDLNALFYILSRGISPTEAKKMLISTFIQDIIQNINLTYIKSQMEQKILKRLF